jgi:hypothetical protein
MMLSFVQRQDVDDLCHDSSPGSMMICSIGSLRADSGAHAQSDFLPLPDLTASFGETLECRRAEDKGLSFETSSFLRKIDGRVDESISWRAVDRIERRNFGA